MENQLLTPARYVPLGRGIYEVAPGLFPFGYDFGQPELDHKIFQLDQNFSSFRSNKRACREENLAKYAPPPDLPAVVAEASARFLVERLVFEWSKWFQLKNRILECALTGENLEFTESWELKDTSVYRDAFDAIANQIPEDFAIVVDQSATDRLGLLHISSPSHWAPAGKAGLDFAAVHAPVAGFEKMAKASRSLVNAMVHKGPYVRFVWSFVTDQRLNHHPDPPPGEDETNWRGRAFNRLALVPFYLRVERQITWGLPDVSAALFFIRVSFVSGLEIRNTPEWRDKLISALESMTQASREYKGVASCFDELVAWLKS